MAWQLIYTSAPRLLEAGRTGFGTVARHRAVSGMLASSIERFSQFARLPGHDPRRVIYSHRLLTVAGGNYHVFSCLQDAGSDYTGRTNHLAQHVIAEAREIRALSTSGLTPADILLAIPWRSGWTDAPRFLDPGEEIDLSIFQPAVSNAWAACTGNKAYARLLCGSQAGKDCYLIPPPGVPLLELFRESLVEAPQNGWQTSFTTSLEPNDDVGDFRWIGLPANSPLRPQAEISNRLLLDLNQPAKLPAPPESPAKAVPATPAPEAAPASCEMPVPIRPPGKVSLGQHPVKAQSAPVRETTMGSWSPESRNKPPQKSRKVLALALVFVALAVASTTGFFLWQHITETKARQAFESEIERIWSENGLALRETRKALADERDVEIGKGNLRSLEDYFSGVRKVLNKQSSEAELKQPENTARPDFEQLQAAFDKWMKIEREGPTTAGASVGELLRSYNRWMTERQECWKALSEHIKIAPLPDVDFSKPGEFTTAAIAVLRKDPPTDASEWKQLNDRLKEKTISAWLQMWNDLHGGDKQKVAENAKKDSSLPLWMKTEAQKVLDSIQKAIDQANKRSKEAMDAEAKRIADETRAKTDDADSLVSKHPIYVFRSVDDAIAKSDKLPIEAEMQIYVGAFADKHTMIGGKTAETAGELKKWLEVDGKYVEGYQSTGAIKFGQTGKITALSASAGEGIRLVARRKDQLRVLFEIRVLSTRSGSKPVLNSPVQVKLLKKGGDILLQGLSALLARINWKESDSNRYQLRRDGALAEQKVFNVDYDSKSDDWLVKDTQVAAQPQPTLQVVSTDIDSQIRAKEQEVKEWEEKVNRKAQGADDGLKRAQEELQKLKNNKAGKSSSPPSEATPPPKNTLPPFSLQQGNYTLLKGTVEVCTIVLTSDAPASRTNSVKP